MSLPLRDQLALIRAGIGAPRGTCLPGSRSGLAVELDGPRKARLFVDIATERFDVPARRHRRVFFMVQGGRTGSFSGVNLVTGMDSWTGRGWARRLVHDARLFTLGLEAL